jgi:formylglycine-generating enzyme required for sulfatase activity
VVRVLALVLAVLVASGASAQEEPRWALVIGNNDYEHIGDLGAAVNDAAAMKRTLEELDFKVIEAPNLTRAGMYRAVRRLQESAAGAVVIVYYAGHGVQIGGRNYLLPVDIEAGSEAEVEDNAVPIDDVLNLLAGARAKLTVAFLDACRDNPLPASLRSAGQGMAYDARVPRGQMVVYSAGPGERALDNLGRGDRDPNGLFVRELMPELRRPGVPLDRAVEAAAVRISERAQAIGHDQNPAIYKAYYGDFYLRPGPVPPPPPPPSAPEPQGFDLRAWDSAERLDTEAGYRAYRDRFCPGGAFCAFADAALQRLQVAAVAPPQVVEPPAAVRPAVGVFGDAARKPGEVFRDCPECPEMVVVPAGEFLMGSPDNEEGRQRDEGPRRVVRIAKPFAIGRYEVTFNEWDACVADGGCGGHRPYDWGWGRGKQPVINVSWYDAQAYVRWLSGKTGSEYRLPTEAEWEYAARAGTRTPFWTGARDSILRANYDGDHAYGKYGKGEHRERTVPVDAAGFPANPFGLYHVHGNVLEWVEDCHHGSYQTAPANGDAWIEENCPHRVQRGGPSIYTKGYSRSAERHMYPPLLSGNSIGFRVARILAY